ncbi:hypothetical protein HYDPIDRAFT_36506 [Hydnomerulius pinastri MD-312]|nr:hypothetical protein HYDPIDRAFT_36506 [Hydnomerulius pinastri MD-312]
METTDTPATNSPASTISETTDTDAVNSSVARVYFGPLQSPEKHFIAHDVARRRALKAGAFGSPVRRSPRLSVLPPPPPPQDGRDTPDQDEQSDDDSDSINDVTAQLSREDTPENDPLPQDVLASRIMRAHDNPSPPPQNRAHPGINYVPGKDGQFPMLDISVPPSPFRAINLFERLNQSAAPPFEPSPGSPNLSPGDPAPRSLAVANISQQDLISFESCSTPAVSFPADPKSREDPAADSSTRILPSTQSTVDDLLSQSPEGPNKNVDGSQQQVSSSEYAKVPEEHRSTVASRFFEANLIGSSATPIVISSLESNIPANLDDHPRTPLRRSSQQSGTHDPPGTHVSQASPSPKSKGKAKAAPPTAEGNDRPKQDRDQEGDRGSSVDSDDLSAAKERRKGKRRAANIKGENTTLHQKLGSLSPQSADVLTRLLPSSHSTSSMEQTLFSADSVPIAPIPTPSTPPRMAASSAPHPNFSQTSVHRPVIAPTPIRPNVIGTSSPLKFSFTVEDTTRTPARRIPVQDALASGTTSVQKALQLSARPDQLQSGRFSTMRAPVFTRPALVDPSHSPAKRVPVADLLASPAKGAQSLGSPTRPALRARSASVEPKPIGPAPARSRSVEPSPTVPRFGDSGKGKESILSKLSTIPRSGAKLPFPLVPGQKSGSDLPHSIPEENENVEMDVGTSDMPQATAGRSPGKSQLKQPSAGSRIPRMGAKPYARPPPKNGKASTTAATSKTLINSTTKAPPFRLARTGSGGSSSDESSAQNINAQRPPNTSAAATLKRKRGPEAVISPPTSRPVMIRQVVPGMLGGKYAPKPQSNPLPQVQEPPGLSPQKSAGPIKFRKVVDGMLSARYAPAKSNPAEPKTSEPPLAQSSTPPDPPSVLTEEPSEGQLSSLPPPTPHEEDELNSSPTRNEVIYPNADANDHSPSHDADEEPSSHLRRTSRTRKPAQQQYVLDVFSGTNATRPPPSRRKPQTRLDGDGFMGMSATALKALTTSNTTKNQQTVAVFATEVIRKEGLRPESPTVKVQTILQKQREERDVRRRERAQRRARRSGEGLEGSDVDGDLSMLDADEHDENDESMPRKHRRGPGDEEDYETPERPERPIKRLRFGEGVEEEVKPAKQVKWHRGLSTAVYLDELHPKPKSRPMDFVIGKGCLAPTVKGLRLDPLGNLVDADNRPFPELVSEHIVVKKFLYDNDIEPEPTPVKVTRSKSKKAKS